MELSMEENSRVWLSRDDPNLQSLLEALERSEDWCIPTDTTLDLKNLLEDLISYFKLPALPNDKLEVETAIFVLSHLHISFCIYLVDIICKNNKNFILSIIDFSKKNYPDANIIIERISIPYVNQYIKDIFSKDTSEYIAKFSEIRNGEI